MILSSAAACPNPPVLMTYNKTADLCDTPKPVGTKQWIIKEYQFTQKWFWMYASGGGNCWITSTLYYETPLSEILSFISSNGPSIRAPSDPDPHDYFASRCWGDVGQTKNTRKQWYFEFENVLSHVGQKWIAEGALEFPQSWARTVLNGKSYFTRYYNNYVTVLVTDASINPTEVCTGCETTNCFATRPTKCNLGKVFYQFGPLFNKINSTSTADFVFYIDEPVVSLKAMSSCDSRSVICFTTARGTHCISDISRKRRDTGDISSVWAKISTLEEELKAHLAAISIITNFNFNTTSSALVRLSQMADYNFQQLVKVVNYEACLESNRIKAITFALYKSDPRMFVSSNLGVPASAVSVYKTSGTLITYSVCSKIVTSCALVGMISGNLCVSVKCANGKFLLENILSASQTNWTCTDGMFWDNGTTIAYYSGGMVYIDGRPSGYKVVDIKQNALYFNTLVEEYLFSNRSKQMSEITKALNETIYTANSKPDFEDVTKFVSQYLDPWGQFMAILFSYGSYLWLAGLTLLYINDRNKFRVIKQLGVRSFKKDNETLKL